MFWYFGTLGMKSVSELVLSIEGRHCFDVELKCELLLSRPGSFRPMGGLLAMALPFVSRAILFFYDT